MTARDVGRSVIAGAAAGLTGTVAMLGMRAFDERYAPMTVADARTARNPAVSLGLRIGGGVVTGVVYGTLRRRGPGASALGDGAAIGAAAYASAALASLLLFRTRRPIWARPFPEIAGGFLRRVAYGVTTAAAFSALQQRERRRR
jgi:hypothetical protein